jgi:meso-butanediol dehydrogenase / (S,S)-butanediol dehydrogenase / diacetyl reductase
MYLGLNGKIAIVTGGAMGIGKGIVSCLVREGATVVIADLNQKAAEKTAQEIGKGTVGMNLDVTKKAEIENLVKDVKEKFGRIDILVNNAGLNIPGSLVELKEEHWDKINDVNLKAVFLVSQAVAPKMIEQKYGKIVNISSMVGKEAFPGVSAYCAAKFGVIGLTQSWAKELANHGINVNAVCPGVVRTPLWDENLLPQMAKDQGISKDEAFAQVCAPIVLKRPQSPEDIGNMVAYLASDIANNMTGKAINVTGGQQMR